MDQGSSKRQLVIVSDVVCPWCYVGKKHLEKAFAASGLEAHFAITWRPYELNPDMPPEGVDRRAYRIRKFGSWEHSQVLDARVAAAGKAAGIGFRHDLMARTPNSFHAHRLLWLAAREGNQNALAEGLFHAYFIEGRDVGERSVLSAIAGEVGMDAARVATFLESTGGAAEVRREEQAALQSGISGVPTFILDGKQIFSGAVGPEIMAAHLRSAVKAM